MRQYPGMKQYHGAAAGAVLLAGSLLWGCSNASVPEASLGSIAGQVTNRGPILTVRLRQIIAADVISSTNSSVNIPVNSDGSFRFSAPQGPATLEFLDARQVPFAYAEVLVQANGTYTLPQPAIGPGPVPSPDPSVNGVSGVLQPGFSGPISATTPGNLSIRAFGPNGTALAVPATVRLYNVNLQGGPSGSVGQSPSATNPGFVSGNSAGIAAARLRQASAGTAGGTAGTAGTTGGTTAGTATAGTTTDTSSTGGAGSNGSTGGASSTAGALSAGGVATSTVGGTTGTTNGASSTNGSTNGATTGSTAGGSSGGTGSTGSAEQNQLGAQTAPFVNFQNAILATVITSPGGAVSISGIPTGAPGLVTPGAVSAFSSSTDAAGNVTLTANAAAAASINPTGGGYQLVPLPVTINGQTLYARQVLLDVLPGVTTHVDLLYTPVQ